MKKFNFRFQKLLEYKESIEDQKRSIYNKELSVYKDEESKLTGLFNKRDDLNKERNHLTSSTTIKGLKLYNQYLTHMQETIHNQKQRVKSKEKDVETAKEKLIESLKEKKTFEKLKEKHYDNYLFEVKKDEEKLIDQIVSFKNGTK